MNGWQEIKLGDVATITAGGDAPKNAFSKTKTDEFAIPVYSNGITDKGLYGYTNKATITKPATTISARGTIGAVFRRTEPYLPIVRLISVIGNEEIVDSDFLYYALCNQRIEGDGSVQAQLTVPMISNYCITIPSLQTQKRIARILSSLDDKIEANKLINRNLEEQAKAIFKSWFVDFEPFQEGEFVDSELGRIPKGWKVGRLADIADITMGQSPSGDSYNEDGEGTVFYQGRGEFSDRFPVRRLYTTEPKRMAKAGDVLLSVRAPVGDINVANEKCCVGRGLAAITAKKGYSSFLLYTLKMNQAQFDQYNGAGTVFGCINKDALNDLKTLVPSETIVFSYENIVHPLDEQYLLNSEENKRLASIRDTLLPKLMSKK